MDIKELIPRDRVLILDKPGDDKMELLHSLLHHCIDDTDVVKYQEKIWQTLVDREKSMSTGIGMGVAMPHCQSEYVHDVMAMLALLKDGIDFQAIDDEPVRIVILLLLPKNKFEKHIKTLASIARLFNNSEFRNKILAASNEDEASEILFSESLQE